MNGQSEGVNNGVEWWLFPVQVIGIEKQLIYLRIVVATMFKTMT